MKPKCPAGVTVISILFFAAALFLWTAGVVRLISPGAISMTTGAPLMYGLELGGPYMSLLVGFTWGVIGWGLFRQQRWARWAAMIAMAIGIGLLVPSVSDAATDFTSRLIWSGGQIMLRAAVAWYLAQSPSVHEAFAKR